MADVTMTEPQLVPHEIKVWGKTRLVYADRSVEIHHATVDRRSYCSCHFHRYKYNRFYVLKGELTVHVYDGDGAPTRPSRSYTVPAGFMFDTNPGHWHRFESGDETLELIEIYWAPDVFSGDIERLDVGGRGDPHAPRPPADHPLKAASPVPQAVAASPQGGQAATPDLEDLITRQEQHWD